jgi:urea transport system permease protein
MITSFILNGLDRRTSIGIIILVLIAFAIPLSNAYLPATNPLHVSTDLMLLFGKYAAFALLALSLDLVWGYCGILSLGHGAFFALGGYAMGMYLMRQIGTRGVYANPILPDFMVFLNWKELPITWWGFNWFPYAMVMVLLIPGLLAFIFGWFAFRSRVTGVYLSIITQAMTYALWLAFFRNDMGFGGNNGLTDFKDILGFNIQAESTRRALFASSVGILAIGLWLASSIVNSKLGKVLIAIRDAESRTRFIGYRVAEYKTVIFTVSACMAGVAGALYVPQVGIINPSEFSAGNSIEAVIWVAVGGRGTLVGAIVGAIAVNWGKTWFTGVFPEVWLFALGALFVAGPLLLPKGIIGSLTDLLAKKKSSQMYAAAQPTAGDVESGASPASVSAE